MLAVVIYESLVYQKKKKKESERICFLLSMRLVKMKSFHKNVVKKVYHYSITKLPLANDMECDKKVKTVGIQESLIQSSW